jgi:large subunit ribosomal protein L10
MTQVSEEKLGIVDDTVKLLDEYHLIGAAGLTKVGSGMLQDMRKQLREQVKIIGIKNTLLRIAMEKAGLEDTKKFMSRVKGQNIYIFSNGNPFELAMTLHRNKVRVFAKEGDIAIEDIVISSGNTGLSPGPIISKFGGLGIRTRIESGNIWVVQDTEVAKPGDTISADLADLLTRLGIRASEMGLEIKAIYENGIVIPREDLILDIDEYSQQFKKAYNNAYQLALKVTYFSPVTIVPLLLMAARNTKKVAIEASYLTKETATEIIMKANAQAVSIAKAVGRAQAKI